MCSVTLHAKCKMGEVIQLQHYPTQQRELLIFGQYTTNSGHSVVVQQSWENALSSSAHIVQNGRSYLTPEVPNSTKRPLNLWTIYFKQWTQCGRLVELGKRAQQLCAQSAKLLKLPPLSFVLTPDSSAPHIVFFQEKVSLISDYYYILTY